MHSLTQSHILPASLRQSYTLSLSCMHSFRHCHTLSPHTITHYHTLSHTVTFSLTHTPWLSGRSLHATARRAGGTRAHTYLSADPKSYTQSAMSSLVPLPHLQPTLTDSGTRTWPAHPSQSTAYDTYLPAGPDSHCPYSTAAVPRGGRPQRSFRCPPLHPCSWR